MHPRVSVVVPTYRRPDLLARCLGALANQDLDAESYEIVVADNAASADTCAQVEAFARQARCVVRYVAAARVRGPAAARNDGWRCASGPVIAFTDDDTVPDPGWLRAGLDAFAEGADAVTGRVCMPLPAVPTDYERNEAGLEVAEFVTANCFIRRAVLAAIGGFDERFRDAWREDSDLHFTLLEAGYAIARAPSAVVVHPVRPAPWGISLRQQRKSQYNALLFKKHPRLYRQRIQAMPPLPYYAMCAALFAAVMAATAGLPHAMIGAALVWLCLVAVFCTLRLTHTSHHPHHVVEMLLTSALIPPLAVFWRVRGALRFGVWFF